MKEKPNRKDLNTEGVMLDIITSALNKKIEEVESLTLTLSRMTKMEDPEFSKKLSFLVSSYSLGSSLIRGVSEPIPVDADSNLEMATIIPPNAAVHAEPILDPIIQSRILNFLEERDNVPLLLERGITPSTSLLLVGKPGTGKTMLAKHIASRLNKHLVVLDLSSSISSLLGKTGQNLKRVLQYAKQTGAVLLLDEFDAIAKRRDDTTDLGEIKRVVNILLMELESWPVSSVVIATSNHPELLDRAIWRRFDHTIEIEYPKENERITILSRELGEFLDKKHASLIRPIAEMLEGKSPADICKFAENVKRRAVLKGIDPIVVCLSELELQTGEKKIRGKFCILAKQILGDSVTVRELGVITGLSPAGVQHHLSKVTA